MNDAMKAVGLYLVIQDFILLLHTCHEGIFTDGTFSLAILFICTFDLFTQRLYIWGQQTVELKVPTFVRRECGSFIVIRRAEECCTLQLVNLGARADIDRYSNTVNAHCSGPEVERGR